MSNEKPDCHESHSQKSVQPAPFPRVDVSKIELAKALKTLRDILPTKSYGNVRRETLATFPEFSRGESEVELDRALTGLSAEDDFAVQCRLMQTVRHIVRLEQRPIVSSKPDAPDFLAYFQFSCCPEENEKALPGYWYLVDVKHTEAEKKKISGESLRRLRSFARQMGFPLLFAVRFDRQGTIPRWAIVEDRDPTTTSITIVKNDQRGVGHLLWDDLGVLMPKGTFFCAFFDRNASDGRFIHPEHGGLMGLHFIRGRGEIVRIGEVEDRLHVYTLFSQLAKVAWVNQDGEKTTEVMVANEHPSFLSQLVTVFNSKLVDNLEEQNLIFNPSRILPRLDVDDHSWLITRSQLDNYIRDMARKGIVQISVFPGTSLHHHLKRQGLTQSSNEADLPNFEPIG